MSETTIPGSVHPLRRVSVRIKLLVFVFIGIALIVLAQTWLNLKSAQEQTENRAHEELEAIGNDFQYDVDSYALAVVAVATSIADRDELISLAQAGDREGLLSLLTPLFHTLRDHYQLNHLYIHDALGNVIVRVHNPEQYGDNVAVYRRTAADAIAQLQPTVGMELGPNFLGLRSVVPLLSEGELVGLVEVGMDFSEDFVLENKAHYNADYTLWLTEDIGRTAGYRLKGDEPLAPLDAIFFYASSRTDLIPVPAEDYQAVLDGDIRYRTLDDHGVASAVVLKPLLGYGGRTFGVLEISSSIQAAVDAMHRDQMSIVLVSAVLAVVSLATFGVVLTQLILRPLHLLTSAAHQQLGGDLEARVAPLGNDEFGQLGQTFNSLSSNVSKLIEGQKASLTEKEQLIRQLREMSRFKDEFLAVMSHELRTPLNAMIGLLGIVMMTGKLDAQDGMMVQRARANSERLLNLINNILDISRMEAGRLKIVPSHISLRELIERIQNDMAVLAEQKQLSLHIHIDPSVPETVFMDEDAVNKIIINLIGNAIKFTETGGITLDLALRQRNLVIRVQDTGVGIPEHMRDVIFESFRQVDSSATRVHGGSGLGLAICKNLSDAMGGSIRVESEMGKGSTFVVTLPLGQASVNGLQKETTYAIRNLQ